MCRLWGVYADDGGEYTTVRDIAMVMFETARTGGNNDGYYIQKESDCIRTLSHEKARAFLENDDGSTWVIGHNRLATHGAVCEKWVHGWEFEGDVRFRGAHNGVGSAKKYENDSYEFFETVAQYLRKNRIDSVKEAIECALQHISTTGVIAIITEKKHYYACIGENMYVAQYTHNETGAKAHAIASKSDIITNKAKQYTKKEKWKWGIVRAVETTAQEVEIPYTYDYVTTETNILIEVNARKRKPVRSRALNTPSKKYITEYSTDEEYYTYYRGYYR